MLSLVPVGVRSFLVPSLVPINGPSLVQFVVHFLVPLIEPGIVPIVTPHLRSAMLFNFPWAVAT